jgi:hypothetical protein
MSAMGKIGSRTAQVGRFVAGWVEDRTGAVSWLARFLNHPAPKRGALEVRGDGAMKNRKGGDCGRGDSKRWARAIGARRH